jgi:hypothetical protein
MQTRDDFLLVSGINALSFTNEDYCKSTMTSGGTNFFSLIPEYMLANIIKAKAVVKKEVACMKLEILADVPTRNSNLPPLLFVHGACHGAWCWKEHYLPNYFPRYKHDMMLDPEWRRVADVMHTFLHGTVSAEKK